MIPIVGVSFGLLGDPAAEFEFHSNERDAKIHATASDVAGDCLKDQLDRGDPEVASLRCARYTTSLDRRLDDLDLGVQGRSFIGDIHSVFSSRQLWSAVRGRSPGIAIGAVGEPGGIIRMRGRPGPGAHHGLAERGTCLELAVKFFCELARSPIGNCPL